MCKIKSISPWLVDFAIRHVDFVLYLPNGQVKFVLDFFLNFLTAFNCTWEHGNVKEKNNNIPTNDSISKSQKEKLTFPLNIYI